jgi:hypothetical protein
MSVRWGNHSNAEFAKENQISMSKLEILLLMSHIGR